MGQQQEPGGAAGRGTGCGNLSHSLYRHPGRWTESGQDFAEYGLLLMLIALIVLAGATVFGTQLSALYATILAQWP